MKNKTKRFDVSIDYYQSNFFYCKIKVELTLCDFNIYIDEVILTKDYSRFKISNIA